MAAPKQTSVTHRAKKRKKRPGIHSKKSQSKLRSSKNYTKSYSGQGR
jgi:hypothetical protein